MLLTILAKKFLGNPGSTFRVFQKVTTNNFVLQEYR